MADTRRELAALQTLLADNTAGDISAQDARDVLVSESPSKIHQTSAYASPPSDPVTGDVWMPSDGSAVYRYSGSAWVPWGPVWPLATPASSGWSWVNQGSATVTTANGIITLSAPAGGSSNSLNCYVRTSPGTPWTATLLLGMVAPPWLTATGTGTCDLGVVWRNSSSGKIVSCGPLLNNTAGNAGQFRGYKWDSATSANTQIQNQAWTAAGVGAPIWMRIGDDGTNRTLEVSTDGYVWRTFYSEARTTFATCDQWGLYLNAHSLPAMLTMFSQNGG